MRVLLLVLVVLGALVLAGYLLGSTVFAVIGVVLLVAGLLLPRKTKCPGLHCSGCQGDH